MSQFMPHGFCLRWDFWLLLMNVGADALIALAYFSISASLAYFVRKRRDINFGFMFWLFSLFIFSCGVTHIFEIIVFWDPVYRMEGWAKIITAVASVVTAVILWRVIPVALRIPTREAMQAADAELQWEAKRREEAERGSRQKDNFLATLSHELRTPLNAIVGWTQILQMQELPPEKKKEALEVIRRNAQAQAQLIDDLLDLSRITAGKIELKNEPVVLANVVEAAITALKPVSDAKCIRVERKFASGEFVVMGDGKRLLQIAWNLLNNALKFTPDGGKVGISIAENKESCEISIKDTGKGIAAEFLPHVFERFRQEDSSFSRAAGGLGIGLALVKELVVLHRGSVRVESEGEGKGTTFIVSLPRPASPLPLPREEKSDIALPLPSLEDVRILIVDDEDDARELMREIFMTAGARVEVASTARQALELVSAKRPQVIISDIAMPDHDGIWLIQQVRRLPAERGGRTKAIAVTALARENERGSILQAGFDGYVPKPLDVGELQRIVWRLALG